MAGRSLAASAAVAADRRGTPAADRCRPSGALSGRGTRGPLTRGSRRAVSRRRDSTRAAGWLNTELSAAWHWVCSDGTSSVSGTRLASDSVADSASHWMSW